MERSRCLKSFIRIEYLLRMVLYCTIPVALLSACSSSDDDVFYEARAQMVMSVGAEGGVVEITDTSSAIYGAGVYIPPGALSTEHDISISGRTIPGKLPSGYRSAGACINFEPDGLVFANPVMMYMPYADTNNDGIVDGKAVSETGVGVLYYNEPDRRWDELDLYGIEADRNRAIIESGHFSTYLAFTDVSDSEPYDTGTPPDQTGDEEGTFISGDCYLEDSHYGLCEFYVLTLTRRSSGLLALIDRNATYTASGYPATISEGYDSATFDAGSAFSRVLESGDAALWQWEAEFVKEHTYLMDYQVVDDPLLSTAIPTSTGTRIYCGIEAVDASMVRISWQINADEQIIYHTSPVSNGHMLVIRLRARYR